MARFKEPRENANKKKTVRDIIDVYNAAPIVRPDQLGTGGALSNRIAQINQAEANAPRRRNLRTRNILSDPNIMGDGGKLSQHMAQYNTNKRASRERRFSPLNPEDLGGGNLSNRVATFTKGQIFNTPDANRSRSANNVFSGLSRFLSAFGERLRGLFTASRDKVTLQDPIAAVTMKDRALEALTASTQSAIKSAFERFSQGRIDRKQFQQEMEMQIRRQALGAAIIGVEGTGNLTQNVIESVRNRVAQQLAYLDGFIKDIEGRSLTNKDRARALQYGTAAFSIAQTAMRQFDLDSSKGGAVELEEKRVLGASDEHCADCVELATDEWEPFGTLPVPGTGTVCGNSCHCELIRRYKEDSTPNTTQEPHDTI